MKWSRLRVFRWFRRSSDNLHETERERMDHRFSRSTSRRLKQDSHPSALSIFDSERRSSFSGVSTSSFELKNQEEASFMMGMDTSSEFIVGDKPAFTGGRADAWMMY
eukprot:m.109829 g.109829  ORF g.109829 m.109829 type:complete len:107 (-) comp15250_c3_seq2:635-955(-)